MLKVVIVIFLAAWVTEACDSGHEPYRIRVDYAGTCSAFLTNRVKDYGPNSDPKGGPRIDYSADCKLRHPKGYNYSTDAQRYA